MQMKRYKVILGVILAVLIVICIYPVSADVISDYRADYDESTQKVHVKVTLTGGEEGARASEYPRDFVILIDVSLSTREVYKDKAMLEWAKNATIDFLESLYPYKSRVGVVTFSDDTTEVCPLTFNFEEVKRSIEGNVSSHGFSTNYGEGIQKAVLVLKGREREALPVIIILTDGGEDKGATSVEDAVDSAMKEGIEIYVVSFGDRRWIDEVMLREKVAKPTGGEYRYTSLDGLSDTLIETTEMEEFLSAANLRILISQSSDTVLDYLSVKEMVSPGVVLSRKGYFEFISPKLTPGKEIELKFDAFSAKKGLINAGIVNVSYLNKEGITKSVNVSAYYKVSPPPLWSSPKILIAVIVLLLILLVFTVMSSGRKIKKVREKGKETVIESLRDVEDKVTELRDCVKDEFCSYGIIMSEGLREKFDEVFKIIEEKRVREEDNRRGEVIEEEKIGEEKEVNEA